MAKLLLGKEVTAAMNEKLQARVAALKEKGVSPKLAIVRCGENPSDVANFEKKFPAEWLWQGAAAQAHTGESGWEIPIPAEKLLQQELVSVRKTNY